MGEAVLETMKLHLNNSLQSQLFSEDLPDDVKAKLYQKTLTHFLNLKQRVPDLEPTSLNGLISESPIRKRVPDLKSPVRKRTRKRAHWPAQPTRYSHRKHIPWTRFGNE